MCDDDRLHFSGVNGRTGGPLQESLTVEAMVDRITVADEREEEAAKKRLKTARDRRAQSDQLWGLADGIDALDVTQAGWGVIFHPDTPVAIRNELEPLVQRRGGRRFQYKEGQGWWSFRDDHEQGPGNVDPTKLPYYLMIVASPAQIPWSFQYGLDVDHAVGRLDLENVAGYRRYVEAVLAYEDSADPGRERRVAVFAPENGDRSTQRSRKFLARPLADVLAGHAYPVEGGGEVAYAVDRIFGDEAKRATLEKLVGRDAHRPTLLFTAGHGVAYPKGDACQESLQGALVAADWPWPPSGSKPLDVPRDALFGAKQVPESADLTGLFVFMFGCYTAGTPEEDDFSHLKGEPPVELAPRSFVAALPKKLLSGGALAVVGHVDRALSCSFLRKGIGVDIAAFKDTLTALLRGQPLGHAFEHVNRRCLSLSALITSSQPGPLRNYLLGSRADGLADSIVRAFIEHNDARGYVVLGDPFVRVRVADLTSA